MTFADLARCNVDEAYHVVFLGEDSSSLRGDREMDMDSNIQSIVEHAQNGQPVRKMYYIFIYSLSSQ